jgi:hypothetical protein
VPHPPRRLLAILGLILMPGPGTLADEPLHARIDALIAARAGARPVGPAAEDAEFLRRVTLDLAGRIPSVSETRAFLQDRTPDKRARRIDRLLASPEYPRRMQEAFHVILMERRGDHPEWTRYLRKSFAANKPFDQMAREILRASPRDEATRGAAFFYTKRLEHYGANPVDYPDLARDVGRLFLGKDFRCAQCHDHLTIADYKQQDFQGLFAFVQNLTLHDAAFPTVAEKPAAGKLAFASVFKKVRHETGPRLPGGPEVAIPALMKGQEFVRPPDPGTKFPGEPRFSVLAALAERVPASPDFSRNAANRLWFLLMGRGLVYPLDQHHSANPPSHPELLDMLAREFVAHHFDIQWLLREIALSQSYQRSSLLPKDGGKNPPALFLTALEKRLSAEQVLGSMLEAAGERERVGEAGLEKLRPLFVKAFGNPAKETEDEINPSLKGTLFVLNDPTVLGWLNPRPGNLIDRLNQLPDAGRVAEELYLAVLSRPPSDEERAEVADYLARHAAGRTKALGQLAWALLASAEFSVNH